MGAFLTIIFELLGVVAKNPIVQKITLFSFFFSLLSFMVEFFVSKVQSALSDFSSVFALASYLGFFNALAIVINFLITGFIIKQILAFIRS